MYSINLRIFQPYFSAIVEPGCLRRGAYSAEVVSVVAAALVSRKRPRMPVRLSNRVAVSVGCAPFFSQESARSSLIFTAIGSTRGLYQPIFSIMRRSEEHTSELQS